MGVAGYHAGGTSVSGALECPPQEQRSIISLDTSQMVSTGVESDKTYWGAEASVLHSIANHCGHISG